MARTPSYPHIIWALGHVVLLICGTRYLIGAAMLKSKELPRWYTAAYLGNIISYLVVVYKSFGLPQLNKAFLQRAAMDENVQYLLLALYWWFTKPIAITLIPYLTFSLFHAITFVRTTVLPIVFPPSPSRPQASGSGASDGSSQAAQQQPQDASTKISKAIQSWVKKNYDPAMRFVSYAEVAIMARVLIGALLFRNSILAPLFYAHFLRLRFYMSTFTRNAFTHVGQTLDGYSQHPSCPEPVRKAYHTVRGLLSRYVDSVLNVQAAGPAAAQPQPAH